MAADGRGSAVALGAAEAELEWIGGVFEAEQSHDPNNWRSVIFGLTLHGRRHYRALLHELRGTVPFLAGAHQRVIVETTIVLDWMAEKPTMRVPQWSAEGYRDRRSMLTDWITLVDKRHDDTDRAQLVARHATADRLRLECLEAAAQAAVELGEPLEDLPTIEEMAKPTANRHKAYVLGYRPLSAHVHVSAQLFTDDMFVPDARGHLRLRDDHPEGPTALRVFGACAIAALYKFAGELLMLDVAGVADAVLVRMMSFEGD